MLQSNNNSHASQPHNNSYSSHFVRRLILTLVLLFVIVSAMSLIAWLIIHPLCPIFTVNSFSVSNFTFSNNSQIKADYDVTVTVKNPNKKVSLVIDHFDILLLYKETPVTKASVMEVVYLEKMRQQNQYLKFSRGFGEKLHRKEFDKMSKDWRSKRVVSFNIKMGIRTRFRSGIWLTKRRLLKVSCMDLVVQFLEPGEIGTLKGRRKHYCSVHFA